MILKWPGGKSKVIPQISIYLPKTYNNYFEPFFGGGALFFYLKPKTAVINDVNETLMNLYEAIKKEPDTIIARLKELTDEHLTFNEDKRKVNYYHKRDEYNETKNKIEKAALLVFLNKTGFNGMYRENSKGKYNIPFGKYANPTIFKESKIREVSLILENTEIKSGSYIKSILEAKPHDFIYFDPPYHPLSVTSSFTSYSKDDFTEKDQVELSKTFENLDKKGCLVMLSNSDTPLIRELYKNYNIHEVQVARSINSKASSRGKVNELIITNYES